MRCGNIFHSNALFRILESTPGQTPCMAVAYDGDRPVAHMLAMVRRMASFIPNRPITQCRIYGKGEYDDGCDKEKVFALMLKAVVEKIKSKLCLYMEFSDISPKMFGYKAFRENGFFHIPWQEIHNPLHHTKPEKLLTYKARKRLAAAYRTGITVKEATSDTITNDFTAILKRHSVTSIRRYIPDSKLFHDLMASGMCKVFTAYEKGIAKGGCACMYSEGNCYLWYVVSTRSIYKSRVNSITIWSAIKDAYGKGCGHIYFMDIGLPFKRDRFRDFILSFGGRPYGTYRWFRFSIRWVNMLLSRLFHE